GPFGGRLGKDGINRVGEFRRTLDQFQFPGCETRQNRSLAEVPRAAGPQNIAQPQGSEPYGKPRLARPVFAMLGRKKRSPIDVDVIGCPVTTIPCLAPDQHETLRSEERRVGTGASALLS